MATDQSNALHDHEGQGNIPSSSAHQFLSSFLTSPLKCCLFSRPYGCLWIHSKLNMLKTKPIVSPLRSSHCVFCLVNSTLFHQGLQVVLSSLRQIFPYFSHPVFFQDTSILLSVHPINLFEFKPCPSLVIWTIAIDSLLTFLSFLFSSFQHLLYYWSFFQISLPLPLP